MKNKKIKIIILVASLLIIFAFLYIALSRNNLTTKLFSNKLQETTNAITLHGNYSPERKQIYLNWDIANSENYIYRCRQKKQNNDSFQTISSTTFAEGEYIKVLNVYPNAGGNLAGWMANYGRDIITVDSVKITDFNSSPYTYLKEGSDWKYDVIVFGFWDSNNGKDLSATSSLATEEFIKAGKGCIFGHDTMIGTGGRGNFGRLASYVNVTLRSSYTKIDSTKVLICKSGIFTSFPWEIGSEGTVLTIPAAHTHSQTANGEIWLKFNHDRLPTNQNFYLTTWNNCAMIQTGHSKGKATDDEQKILANLIFYLNQLTSDTELYDYSIVDEAKPTKVENISQTTSNDGNITLSFPESQDMGTKYSYYVEGIAKDDSSNNVQSNTIEVEALSGIAGYSYIIDNKSTCSKIDTTIESTSSTININSSNGINWFEPVYFHIAAVDNFNNVSDITTISLNLEIDPIVFWYKPATNNILMGVLSRNKTLKSITYEGTNSDKQKTLNVDFVNRFAVDYNLGQTKTISVELVLDDNTKVTREITIPEKTTTL